MTQKATTLFRKIQEGPKGRSRDVSLGAGFGQTKDLKCRVFLFFSFFFFFWCVPKADRKNSARTVQICSDRQVFFLSGFGI